MLKQLGSLVASVASGGWLSVARIVAPIVGVVLIVLSVLHWYHGKLDAAYERGSNEQVAADLKAVTRAFIAANAAQDRLNAKLAAAQAVISKGTENATAANDRAAADAVRAWRLRHPEARRPAGGPVDAQAAALPGAAAFDHAPDATDPGGIFVDPQVIADAAVDAGQATECTAWISKQQALWPPK